MDGTNRGVCGRCGQSHDRHANGQCDLAAVRRRRQAANRRARPHTPVHPALVGTTGVAAREVRAAGRQRRGHMFTVYVFEPAAPAELLELERYRTVAEAVQDTLEFWNEEEGPQTFLVQAPGGWVEAVLLRPDGDPELCSVMYRDGRIERRRVRYVLDEAGKYLRTEVSPA